MVGCPFFLHIYSKAEFGGNWQMESNMNVTLHPFVTIICSYYQEAMLCLVEII